MAQDHRIKSVQDIIGSTVSFDGGKEGKVLRTNGMMARVVDTDGENLWRDFRQLTVLSVPNQEGLQVEIDASPNEQAPFDKPQEHSTGMNNMIHKDRVVGTHNGYYTRNDGGGDGRRSISMNTGSRTGHRTDGAALFQKRAAAAAAFESERAPALSTVRASPTLDISTAAYSSAWAKTAVRDEPDEKPQRKMKNVAEDIQTYIDNYEPNTEPIFALPAEAHANLYPTPMTQEEEFLGLLEEGKAIGVEFGNGPLPLDVLESSEYLSGLVNYWEPTKEHFIAVANRDMKELREGMSSEARSELDKKLYACCVEGNEDPDQAKTVYSLLVAGADANFCVPDPSEAFRGSILSRMPGADHVPMLYFCAVYYSFNVVPLLLAAGANPELKYRIRGEDGKENVWEWSAHEQAAKMLTQVAEEARWYASNGIEWNSVYKFEFVFPPYRTFLAFHGGSF